MACNVRLSLHINRNYLMNLSLFHGQTTSAIVADEKIVEYSRNIHRYESESDYKTVVTELNTYGIKAAQNVIDYLVGARK